MTQPSSTPTPKGPGSWFVTLFLSLFVVIGSGCLLYAPLKLVRTVLFIRSAAETTGTVVDLVASRNSRSTTYAPVVAFTTPDGRRLQFRSQISSSSADYSLGTGVAVYYDPLQPAQAEIKAFIPLWMPSIILFALGLAFTALGGGVMAAMRRGIREEKRREAARQQGMKDWEIDPAWRSGTIPSVARQEMWFSLLFALAWNAIAQPTGFIALHEVMEKGNRLASLGVIFPLVGLWLLTVAVRKTLQLRKFGEITLAMDPSPGSLGGEVGGSVELPLPFSRDQIFTVTLSALQVTPGPKSTLQKLLWQEEGRASAAPAPGGTRVAFRFSLPGELPPSSATPERSYQWQLCLGADLPGIDLDRTFVIPVVATAPPLSSSLAIPLAPDLAPTEAIPPRIVRIEKNGEDLFFFYPRRRHLQSALTTLVVGSTFLFFTGLVSVKAAGAGIFLLPFLGLIGLGLLLSSFWFFTSSLEVEAREKEIVVARRLLGFVFYRRTLPTADLLGIETKESGMVGAGNTARLLFSVAAHGRDGSRIVIGDGIAGRTLAARIAGMIKKKYARAGKGAAATTPSPLGSKASATD